MDTIIDRYIETILAPHLVDLGVAHRPGALVAVVTDVCLRLQSVLVHWQDLSMRKTLLLIGREEGIFYEPELAPLDIRSLVVVTIRNSLLEDLGSSRSALLPPDLRRSTLPVRDEDIRFITQKAIVYWQQIDLDHLPLATHSSSQDIFDDLKRDFPHAWYVLSRLAQMKTQTISFPACQAPLPELPISSLTVDESKQTRVESGINPLFDSQLVKLLRAIQDTETDLLFTDSWKMLTRHPQKLFRILDFVLAHQGSIVTHNYLLTTTMASTRQGLLKPAHRTQSVITKFQNQAGLSTAHRKALGVAKKLYL